MKPLAILVLLLAASPVTAGGQQDPDTVRLEVGSPLLDGRVYLPHAARVRVRVGDPAGPVTAEWTNELDLGDSAGRRVMRWITKGRRTQPDGTALTWELRQTYDARTLAPMGYLSTRSTGQHVQLRLDGTRVTGTRRAAADSATHAVDVSLDRAGYFAGASDLVPAAVGLRAGTVIRAPVWSPAMTQAEWRIFTVVGMSPVTVEGTPMEAWKVEERDAGDRRLLATWYLLDASPYMVYGEAMLPDGRIQYMSEVEIPRTARR